MLSLYAKRWALLNPVGRLLMSGRSSYQLIRTAVRSPSDVGMLVNDQLAGFLVAHLCQPGHVFIDIGAHIGSVISEVLRHDRNVSIIAVEAIPDKAKHLRAMFPKVVVHNCAVGDSTGDVSFFVDTRQSGYSSLSLPESGSTPEEILEIKVTMQRMDDLVSLQNVDVIKIDVEGAELGVLRGAQMLLQRCRPVIMFESGPLDAEGLGFTKEGMWQFLHERQYGLHLPSRLAHDDVPLGKEGYLESHLYPRRTTNYFAIPMERRLEIRDRARALLGISNRPTQARSTVADRHVPSPSA
jgi:FkbM family methyltransferase